MNKLHGKMKKTILFSALAVALGTVAVQMVSADTNSSVVIGSAGLSYTALNSDSVLTLSVAGVKMDVVSVRSTSGISWNLPYNVADGSYNYELTVVTPSADGKEENAIVKRIHGTFEVGNGVINNTPEDVISDDNGADDVSDISDILKGLGVALLDFIIPSANAANLVADSATNPNVLYQEGGVNKWLTQSLSVAPYDDAFRKYSYGNSKTVELLQENSHFLTYNSGTHWFLKTAAASPDYAGTAPIYISIHKDANDVLVGGSGGNVHLADSTVFIDKTNNRVGIGTITPTKNLEIASSNPTIILNDTNGDTKWSLNESTSGGLFDIGASTSAIPYERKFWISKDAGRSSLALGADGVSVGGETGSTVNLGIGTNAPSSSLHIKRAGAELTVENSHGTTAVRNVVKLKNNGGVGFQLEDTSNTNKWEFRTGGSGAFLISDVNVGGAKLLMNSTGLVNMGKNVAAGSNAWNFELDANGDLHIAGNMFVSGTQLTVPDYVFADDYKLMPLDELQNFVQKEKHLPNIASESEVKKAKAVNVGKSQMRHLEKIEELTLYTIQQHQQIKDQQQQIEALRKSVSENTKMKKRLASLENLVTNLASANGHLSLSGEKVVTAK